jgi:phosphatidylserine/phosphatidylglycerophosphate/cardiolipin synthase-like enzyme
VEVVQSFPIETSLQVRGIAQTQQVWLDIVNSATQTLDIEQYYINNQAGQSLAPVIDAIKAAAARGVQIRVILDSAFLKSSADEANDLLGVNGVEVRQVDFSPGIMHAKYMVADGVNAYTGSANMDWLALSHIHEMGVHTVDATVGSELESIFNTDWPNATKLSGSAVLPTFSLARFIPFMSFATGLPGIGVVASPKSANPMDIPDSLSAVTDMIGDASQSLDVQVYEYSTTPYSGHGSPWTALDDAIRAAANRGVKVRLMVDATVMNSHSKTALQALAKLSNIQIRTITIPQWSGGPLKYARLIHSKYLVVDGGTSAWIGSENWIDSYFLNTRNVGILIQDPTVAAQAEQVYQSVWGSAYGEALTAN